MKISAIIPCLNEELNIELAYQHIVSILLHYDDYEIIFIDDGSTDNTLLIIKTLAERNEKVKYISFMRNFGVEAAIRYGYLYASHEWCIHYDADLQWPPEETHKLTQKADLGYDAVFGIRKNRNDKLYRIIGAKAQQFIARKLLSIEIPKGASTFRLVKTSIAKKAIFYPTKTPYFLATIPIITSNYTSVEINHNKRIYGKSKFGLSKMFNHSCELFFGYSDKMLNFSAIAFVFGSIGFVIILIISMINPTQGIMPLVILLCLLSLAHLLSKTISDQYAKYPANSYVYHDTIFVRQSNIESCIEERVENEIAIH